MITALNLGRTLSGPWAAPIYVAGALMGLVPLVLDVAGSVRRKKLDLGLPVLATIVILLCLREYLLADVFVLLIVVGDVFKEYVLWRVERRSPKPM